MKMYGIVTVLSMLVVLALVNSFQQRFRPNGRMLVLKQSMKQDNQKVKDRKHDFFNDLSDLLIDALHGAMRPKPSSDLKFVKPDNGNFRRAESHEEPVKIEDVLNELQSKYYKEGREKDHSTATEHLATLLFELDDMEVFGMLQEYIHENQDKYQDTLAVTHKVLNHVDPAKAKEQHKGMHLDFKLLKDILQNELDMEMRGYGPISAVFH